MDSNTNFWLVYIQDNQLSVSLISQADHRYQILATGSKKEWNLESEESLITAADESLSAASLNAGISEEQEPSSAAFVVPPFWIGNDGKINAPKLKLIKDLCKSLKLNPTGFLPEDEAIVEETHQRENFPASFIILHLNQSDFYLSLIYMGHVKERIRKIFSGEFTGQILESALLEFNSESALPPQIMVFGSTDESITDNLKNFPWVGRKDVETFLHFPDIKFYSDHDILNIFAKVIIGSQISETSHEEIQDESESELVDSNLPIEEISLEEVDASSLGFSDLTPEPPLIPEPGLDPFVPEVLPPPTTIKNLPKIKISLDFLKKIKFPKIKPGNLFWILLIILPFLVAVPLFFIKANITLFITPYSFNKSISVILKTNSDDSNLNKIIPVDKQVFDITATDKIATTGQKTIGDKAKGEIIIYNKVNKVQNIPQGSIIIDSSGKKFELTNDISVASSSSSFNDQNQLITTSGQTRTTAIASDIGSEFNIAKDTQLNFKDFTDTVLIAKVDSDFTGGSKSQISAVSSQDKTNLTQKINQEITDNINSKIQNDLNNTAGVIKETIQTQKSQLDFNREVNEDADELSVTAKSSVTVFTLKTDIKEKLINQSLSDQPDFNNAAIDASKFNLSFKVDKIDVNQATGTLTINGDSLPKLDLTKIKKSLSAKTKNSAEDLIKKTINRVYNFNIQTNFPLGLLPFKWQNISIQVKSENL